MFFILEWDSARDCFSTVPGHRFEDIETALAVARAAIAKSSEERTLIVVGSHTVLRCEKRVTIERTESHT